MENSQLLQNLLRILGINQKADLNHQNQLNFQVISQNQHKILKFDGQIQKYLFLESDCQLQHEDKTDLIIYKNSKQFSLISIIEYLYIKKTTQKSCLNYKSDFISLCNYFMVALGQTRVYTNCQVKWNIWNTYWSTPSRLVNCYSNCSGQCNSQTCTGGQCLYIFPADELNNCNLPEKERSDPNNRFDDNLFFLAKIFYDFVIEEVYKFKNFFFSYQLKSQQKNIPAQQNLMYLNLGCDEKTLDIIQVEILSGEVLKLKSLSQLYNIEKNQIQSISMLSLNEKDIPKGEKQRKQLYDFIFQIQQLHTSIQYEFITHYYITSMGILSYVYNNIKSTISVDQINQLQISISLGLQYCMVKL
ncbi:hypothetical protein ABPG72_022316 [Tetrahymena utriculariae]